MKSIYYGRFNGSKPEDCTELIQIIPDAGSLEGKYGNVEGWIYTGKRWHRDDLRVRQLYNSMLREPGCRRVEENELEAILPALERNRYLAQKEKDAWLNLTETVKRSASDFYRLTNVLKKVSAVEFQEKVEIKTPEAIMELVEKYEKEL